MAGHDELPGLLRLPRELRNEIYAYIATEHAKPPVSPSSAGRLISDLDGTLRYQDPKDAVQSGYHALAKTNRQLRAEVQDYALTHRTSNREAELDVMFDGLSYPTWIYLPLDVARDDPFDLKARFRIFSVYTFDEYQEISNSDGWQYGNMSAAFLDFLILLRRLVRYGPSFGLSLPSDVNKPNYSNGAVHNLGCFRLRSLSIDVTYHNDISNGGNNSNIIKCFKNLAHTGLTRGAIDQIKIHWRFQDYFGSARENEKIFNVEQEWNEDKMVRAVKRGFFHTTNDSLFDCPFENTQAVKNYEWCCG